MADGWGGFEREISVTFLAAFVRMRTRTEFSQIRLRIPLPAGGPLDGFENVALDGGFAAFRVRAKAEDSATAERAAGDGRGARHDAFGCAVFGDLRGEGAERFI